MRNINRFSSSRGCGKTQSALQLSIFAITIYLVDPEKVILRHTEVEYFGLEGLGGRATRSMPPSGGTEKCA
ncbi:MAG: hypothetical protein ABSA42_00005, partial [Terracidiphilus sp.]